MAVEFATTVVVVDALSLVCANAATERAERMAKAFIMGHVDWY